MLGGILTKFCKLLSTKNNSMTTYLPSIKQSKQENDMRDTAGKARTKS